MPAVAVGAIGAGATIYGANKQAGSNRDAIKAQTDANNRALQFEGRRYADTTNRLQPWTTAGQNSVSKMAQLLGLPDTYTPPAGAPVATPPKETELPVRRTPGSHFHVAGPPVRMRAPDGQETDVHPSEVEHFQKLGAVRVSP